MKLLKFTADWCGACKSLTKQLEPYKDKITEIDLGTDEGEQLAANYNVKSLPTVIVLNDNDDIIDILIGQKPINEYLRYLM